MRHRSLLKTEKFFKMWKSENQASKVQNSKKKNEIIKIQQNIPDNSN